MREAFPAKEDSNGSLLLFSAPQGDSSPKQPEAASCEPGRAGLSGRLFALPWFARRSFGRQQPRANPVQVVGQNPETDVAFVAA